MSNDRIGLIVAVIGLFVSILVAADQGQKTREVMAESKIQSRIATCTSLAGHYAAQSWLYQPIPPNKFEDYGLPADTQYFEDDIAGRQQANQVLESFSRKAVAAGRAAQICMNENNSTRMIQSCIISDVDLERDHWVDDDADGEVDRVIC